MDADHISKDQPTPMTPASPLVSSSPDTWTWKASMHCVLLDSKGVCVAVHPSVQDNTFYLKRAEIKHAPISHLLHTSLAEQLNEKIIHPILKGKQSSARMLVHSSEVLKGVKVFSISSRLITWKEERHILLEFLPQDETYALMKKEVSQRNFTDLLELLQDGVLWLCTQTHRVMYANTSALALLGYQMEEIFETDISSYYPTEKADEYVSFFKDHTQELEEEAHGNFWFKNRRGELVPVSMNRNIIQVEDNTAQQLIFRDNTERVEGIRKLKEGEQELIRAEENLLEAQRLGNIGSGVLDILNGRVEFTAHARHIWGLEDKEVITLKDLFRRVHPSDIKTVKKIYKRVISARSEESMTIRIRVNEGEEKYLNCSLKPLLTDNFQIHRIFGTSQDITVLKQAETEVRKALDKETQLNELRSHFVAIVSHQYRTPLTIIRSSADLIPMIVGDIGWEKLEDINRYVKKITHEVERMNSLLDEVLSYESIERGSISFSPRPTDCIGWIRRLAAKYHDFLGDGRGIRLQIMSPACSVMMDAKLLEHAIGNILGNALKYSVGNPEPELEVWNEGYNVYFSIRDYGIGIPEKELQNLFHPFFRASNTKNMDGTGMGLAISKQLIELHLGSISIANGKEEGAEVLISIPSGFPV